MKRVFGCALVLVALVFVLVPAFAEETVITLALFDQKFEEVNQYFNTLFSLPHAREIPVIEPVPGRDDLFAFTYPSSIVLVRGTAYSDTGVIASLLVQMMEFDPELYLDVIRVQAALYAMSGTEGEVDVDLVAGWSDSLDLDAAVKDSIRANGYNMRLDNAPGDEEWLLSFGFERIGEKPSKQQLASPMDYDDYLLYFSRIQAGETAQPTDRPKGTIDPDAVTLSSGEYIVGQHIAAGEYSARARDAAYLGISRDGDLYLSEALSKDNEVERTVLEDTDLIQIRGGEVIFSSLKSW